MFVPSPTLSPPAGPTIVLLANEKGGSGKSTLAIHIAVALARLGQRAAIVDLDARQRTSAHFIQRRKAREHRAKAPLGTPGLYEIEPRTAATMSQVETTDIERFERILASVEGKYDFVVIDTPAADSRLVRLAHARADIVITPLNESFVDAFVLASVDPVTFEPTNKGHYAELIGAVRRARRQKGLPELRWYVFRNRFSPRDEPDDRKRSFLRQLTATLGFHLRDGLPERRLYEQFFPAGLTVADDVLRDAAPSDTDLILQAREEVYGLLRALPLAVDGTRFRRAAAQAEWFAGRDRAPEMDEALFGHN